MVFIFGFDQILNVFCVCYIKRSLATQISAQTEEVTINQNRYRNNKKLRKEVVLDIILKFRKEVKLIRFVKAVRKIRCG